MAAVMRVEVVSPERVLFVGEATMVVTRVIEGGDIAFMPGHAPFLGALTECHTRLHLEDGRVQDVAVHGGFVEVGADHVSLLTDMAELGEHVDVDRARSAKERAEEHLRQEHDAEVEASLRRAHARLLAAGGPGGH
jgi:F-type H+-transporting ATPase subunit epsilon